MTTQDDDGNGARRESQRPLVPKTASEALRPQAGTPPPRRSRQSRNQFIVFMNFMMSLVVFIVVAGGLAFYLGKQAFDGAGPLASTDTVLIRPNTGVAEIADILERRGMISDARLFRVGLRLYGHDSSLRAGEYEIRAGASMYDIMELLRSGRSVEYAITVPEGFTVFQAFQRIAAMEELAGDMPDELPPEGSLAATTLRFTRGMQRQDLIQRLMNDQERLVQSIWERRVDGLPINDINEFVTLASIVERETGRSDERSRVASVFINRLNRGMRLQSDPTIIYGIFGGEGLPPGRPIYRSDIDTPTEYNTYTINGLPPGPIAIPGRASLEAVANPSQTNDLYFVADGSGGHAFAQTLDEHNSNVARWRAIERERAEAAARRAAEEAEEEAAD
ncbi:MAG: endolytic transglycosylase MltG [Aliihoeflea sp.]